MIKTSESSNKHQALDKLVQLDVAREVCCVLLEICLLLTKGFVDLSWIRWHEDPRWISAGMRPVSEGMCCCAEAETTSNISMAFMHWAVPRGDAQCGCCLELCEGQGSTRRSAKHAVPRATRRREWVFNGGAMPVPSSLCLKWSGSLSWC